MTDMNLLRGLIGSRKLSASQEKAFSQMLQDLVDGKLVGLTKGQKEWAMQIFNGLNLHVGKMILSPMPVPRKEYNAGPTIFEQPKPLKPPGRA